MVRYLKESDVEQLLDMPMALEQVELALKDRALARSVDVPRERTHIPAGTLHIMQAGAPGLNLIGYKAYYATPKGIRYHLHLYDAASGKLTAIIEASYLGLVRTGAASGVATRLLARKDAAVVAMIGAGKQAIAQLEAVCSVRSVREVRVYNRTPERAQRFCEIMGSRLRGTTLRAVPTAADAVHGAAIINVITKAASPVLLGEWLEPGQHVNAAGSNSLTRRELDEAAVKRCACVVVDSRTTARRECGDLLPIVEKGFADWDVLPELGELIVGRVPGRLAEDDITLFESQGMAVQDLYVGHRILALARERGMGLDLSIDD